MAWRPVLPNLSAHFRVFTLILPGFQQRGLRKDPPTLEQYAGILQEFLHSVVASPAVLVATSFGGQIAATLAMSSTRSIRRLVLIASSGLTPHRVLRSYPLIRMIEALTRLAVFGKPRLLCRIAERAFYDVRTRPQELCTEFSRMVCAPGNARAWFWAMNFALTADGRWKEGLLRIDVPTLILWGREDKIVPPSAAGEFLARIPDSRLIVFDRCGHSVPLEKTQELTDHLLAFALRPAGGGRKFSE